MGPFPPLSLPRIRWRYCALTCFTCQIFKPNKAVNETGYVTYVISIYNYYYIYEHLYPLDFFAQFAYEGSKDNIDDTVF